MSYIDVDVRVAAHQKRPGATVVIARAHGMLRTRRRALLTLAGSRVMPGVVARLVALVAPALFPSWRFFDGIGPSPRLRYGLLSADGSEHWHDLPLVPAQWSPALAVARLLMNATRNESLYLVSCCARVLEDGRPYAQQEIARGIVQHAVATGQLRPTDDALRFDILEVSRDAGAVQTRLAFSSPAFPIGAVAARRPVA